ncbi:MAG: ribonuclease P protein component [Hyphomonadaceae bacterium]|nr:ribonuclease P protein component [Hyphomonadaceae bacterium]
MRKRAQFVFVRHGVKATRPNVMIEARRRADAGAVGVGFTASRKVGGAVTRNRARRRLREAARQLLPDLGLPGVDYVLVARAATADAAWEALLDDVRNALIRLRADLGRGHSSGRSSAVTTPPPSTESD